MAYEFDLVRDVFDPVKAMEEMGVICKTLFARFPVIKEKGVEYCNSTWDSFLCWPATPVGVVAAQPCPPIEATATAAAVLNATRECMPNGTWERTRYDDCLSGGIPKHHLDSYENIDSKTGVNVIYYVGYSITIVALIIALAIFGYFRSLRCLRNIIHCNLLCGFLLNSIAWIVLHSTVKSVYYSNPTLCTCMVIVTNHLHSVPFYWMFIEGLYLFTIIVWAFSASKIKLWYYLLLGWGVPVIPTAVWAAVKMHVLERNCLLTAEINYDFIIHGPILLLLGLNVFFITAIIWVLVTKLRASNTLETRQSRKATKATVVLFPLLGVTYIFFVKEPVHSKDLNITFSYINALLQSFQGLFVAIIYCFLNGEVRSLVRLKLSALQDSRTLSRYTRSSFFGSPRRSSCYAMATTTCNGRNTLVPGGVSVTGQTSCSNSNLVSQPGGTKPGSGEEATVLVMCGDGQPEPCSNGDHRKQQKNKVLRSGEGETEASEAMMENML